MAFSRSLRDDLCKSKSSKERRFSEFKSIKDSWGRINHLYEIKLLFDRNEVELPDAVPYGTSTFISNQLLYNDDSVLSGVSSTHAFLFSINESSTIPILFVVHALTWRIIQEIIPIIAKKADAHHLKNKRFSFLYLPIIFIQLLSTNISRSLFIDPSIHDTIIDLSSSDNLPFSVESDS